MSIREDRRLAEEQSISDRLDKLETMVAHLALSITVLERRYEELFILYLNPATSIKEALNK